MSSVPPTEPLAGDKPQRYISLSTGLSLFGRRWLVSRIGVRDMLSYQ